MDKEQGAEEVKETETPETETKTASEDLSQALDRALAESDKPDEEKAAPAPAAEKEAAAPEEKPLSPPAEWTGEEKEAFKELNVKSQKAALRLHQSNRAEFTRFRQEKGQFEQESATIKQLADTVKPFIEATGKQGKNPYQSIQEAVAIVQEIRANPKMLQALEAARKGGGDAATTGAAPADDKISSVLATVEELKRELATERTQKAAQFFGQTFSEVVGVKNAAGGTRLPDINDTDAGLKLAGLVGSTIRSSEFQQAVLARNPNANLKDMIVEAYRWHGGRVDDAAGNGQSTPQKHIQTAKKAAASKPGRAPVSAGPNPKKYTTLSGALDAALADLD